MRDNSADTKGKNNMRDPTVRDHEGGKGPAQQSPHMQEGGSAFDIAGNVTERGENPSPSDRDRGEASAKDRALPIDTD